MHGAGTRYYAFPSTAPVDFSVQNIPGTLRIYAERTVPLASGRQHTLWRLLFDSEDQITSGMQMLMDGMDVFAAVHGAELPRCLHSRELSASAKSATTASVVSQLDELLRAEEERLRGYYSRLEKEARREERARFHDEAWL
ncbi:hypothetical protein EON66_07100 [archaeon]|nr:MAG: hypothetical protein EON66_07100 [archaeon]